MAQDRDTLRRQVEETRERVGEDVEALRYKTDLGARTSDYVEEKKDAVVSKVVGARDAVTGRLPSGPDVGRGARRADSIAHRNPLGLAVGGAAVGFLAGLLLPSTRVEDERLGDVADRVKETGKELGEQAVERGMDVARSAADVARDEGATQAKELASDLRERVQPETEREQV